MKLEQTADGSYTLYVPELDEHYHSVKGALTESEHIFIQMGLNHCPVTEPRILEIGLGTGLNCFLTYLTSEQNQRPIHYTGIERYPLDEEIIRQLDYPRWIGRGHEADFYQIHQAEWGKDVQLSSLFTLHKIEGDFTQYFCHSEKRSDEESENTHLTHTDSSHPLRMTKRGYDLVYFDAFAPEKQPEMWSQALFDTLYNLLNEGGILTTYCAKGVVRRMLQAAGFTVERLPGPPGGKREILRATKL